MQYLLIFFVTFLVILITYHGLRMIETIYARFSGKPFYVHFYPVKSKLNRGQLQILDENFQFYRKLKKEEQRYFQHRLAKFLNNKDFEGREGIEVSDEIKVMIGSTAVMLTFGMRDYSLEMVERIIVYPGQYYSQLNKEYHIGEFSPKFKALVFSWKDFKSGMEVANDNRNLGIHEFAHVIHLTSIKNRDTSATIFSDGFGDLQRMLRNDELLRKLHESEYIREYAFTNKFEFIAVLLENFIETPLAFRSEFPDVYLTIKQMLNFNYAGY